MKSLPPPIISADSANAVSKIMYYSCGVSKSGVLNMTTVQIHLPDTLAQRARSQGLLYGLHRSFPGSAFYPPGTIQPVRQTSDVARLYTNGNGMRPLFIIKGSLHNSPVIAARSEAKSPQSTRRMDPATSRRMTSGGC